MTADPFRSLSVRCAPLIVSDAARPEMRSAAQRAYEAVRLAYPNNDGMSATELAMVQAFETAVKLNFEPVETRDLLWAAIKLFATARAASARAEGWPARPPSYYWLND